MIKKIIRQNHAKYVSYQQSNWIAFKQMKQTQSMQRIIITVAESGGFQVTAFQVTRLYSLPANRGVSHHYPTSGDHKRG